MKRRRRADRSIAIVFGTRPEIIKLAGIVEILGDQAKLIFSGQHFDEKLSQLFFDDLALPPPDVTLGVGGQTRSSQISQILGKLGDEFASERPVAVVVQGDTNTVVGGALAANAAEVPLVHVEAGLRSFDRRMPEEHNRVVTDHLADLCLAPTCHAQENLLREGISSGRIAVTGNTVVDAALRVLPAPEVRATHLVRHGLERAHFVLATFHRPENVDDIERLRTILEQLDALDLPVVLPLHPRTRHRIEEYELARVAQRVKFVEPVGYAEFLALAAESALLISDSGGVQEEASVVKRPVLVVRRSTERPEVIGSFATLVPDLHTIAGITRRLLEDIDERHRALAMLPSVFGDGDASQRCVVEITRLLESTAATGG